jgi:hypothetical protein
MSNVDIRTKLDGAPLPAGQVLIGQANGRSAFKTLSGDMTADNDGALTAKQKLLDDLLYHGNTWVIPTAAGWTELKTGGAGVTTAGSSRLEFLIPSAGPVVNQYAFRHVVIDGNTSSGNSIDWTRNLKLQGMWYISGNDAECSRWIMLQQGQITTPGALEYQGIALKTLNRALYIQSRDVGGTVSDYNCSVTLGLGTYKIELIWVAGTGAYIRINSTLYGPKTNNLPSNNTGADGDIAAGIMNGATGGVQIVDRFASPIFSIAKWW